MADTEPQAPLAQRPLPEPAKVALTDQVVVRVAGPGTDKFLHGQFSQSLDSVTDQHAPRAAACNPKGRAYALTRLVRFDADVLFSLSAPLARDTLAHLNKYRMLFRGTSMEPEASACIHGLLGEQAAERLLPGVTASLAGPGAVAAIGLHRLIRTEDTAGGLHRFEFWQNGALDASLAEAFAQIPEASLVNWHGSEIAAGIATLTPESRESWIPQMLNWQHVDGIHFKKGCYTGQEVIARMHFLGQLKKSLYRLRADSPGVLPKTGESVVAGDKPAGEVVTAVAYDDGSSEILAILRHDQAQSELSLSGSTPLHLLDLPYPVPEREAENSPDT